MQIINARNVGAALPEALHQLDVFGYERDSRNGKVSLFSGPVTTLYRKPLERVIFWPERDANPFFHLMEAMWMLAGRNDVAFPARYAKNIAQYSDDGETFHGAYGHRWRQHFGFDQLGVIIHALKENPDDRRNVLQMWDAEADLGRVGKDVPCNTQAYFSRDADGRLDMTVCNRSNDIVWGCYGANAVHFSMLQEYVASAIGCEVGQYWQMSNNLHAYHDTLKKVESLKDQAPNIYRNEGQVAEPYALELVEPFPLMSVDVKTWQQDLAIFLDEGPIVGLRDPFFRKVLTPIFLAHRAYKEGEGLARYENALEILEQCAASDWKRACVEWIARRETAYLQRVKDDGPSHA